MRPAMQLHFDVGNLARRKGLPRLSCPWAYGSDHARAWSRGWREEDRDIAAGVSVEVERGERVREALR